MGYSKKFALFKLDIKLDARPLIFGENWQKPTKKGG
jgi:hypothetical protein